MISKNILHPHCRNRVKLTLCQKVQKDLACCLCKKIVLVCVLRVEAYSKQLEGEINNSHL